MSIQKRTRKKGNVYVVHYYDTDRKTHVNKTFDLRKDAVAYESIVNLAKRRGELAQLDAGTETLTTFAAKWWSSYGDRFLAENTKKAYRDLFKRFITPELGDVPLRRITPSRVVTLRDLVQDASGDETARKTVALLQGVLERAVEWEHLQINPVKAVKKPAQQRQSRARVLDPSGIERLVDSLGRTKLVGDDQHQRVTSLDTGGPGSVAARVRPSRSRTKTSRENVLLGQSRILIYLMGYAGLRPGEALALEWGDVGAATLNVSKSAALGTIGGTKTGHVRLVRLLGPLKQELDRFRLGSGTRTGRLVSRADGLPWRDTDYRNWRKRFFGPAAQHYERLLLGESEGGVHGADEPVHAERSSLRPYDLRHSFASLLFHEGRSPAYIAEQMGHTIQTLLSTYVHIIEELRDEPRQDAEELIRSARLRKPDMDEQSSHA